MYIITSLSSLLSNWEWVWETKRAKIGGAKDIREEYIKLPFRTFGAWNMSSEQIALPMNTCNSMGLWGYFNKLSIKLKMEGSSTCMRRKGRMPCCCLTRTSIKGRICGDAVMEDVVDVEKVECDKKGRPWERELEIKIANARVSGRCPCLE
jgi:hypothetical protein